MASHTLSVFDEIQNGFTDTEDGNFFLDTRDINDSTIFYKVPYFSIYYFSVTGVLRLSILTLDYFFNPPIVSHEKILS